MKAIFSLIGVFGLAVAFGLAEPVPASSQRVTLDDVQLVSEQTSSNAGPQVAGRYANKNGRGSRRGGRGAGVRG